jgi:hypothetical protein
VPTFRIAHLVIPHRRGARALACARTQALS